MTPKTTPTGEPRGAQGHYDYCPHCHSEHRKQVLRTGIITCLDCGHDEPAAFRVHVGYTALGNDRWRFFHTLDAASAFCLTVFTKANIVLTVQRNP